MICPQCHSPNARVDFVQSASRSSHTGTGLGGHTNNAARAVTALSTLGMSNLVWKKSKGGSKQKFKTQKMGLCQDCGASWNVR
ncbi:hypothetical protein [Corynebacterium heidelbergense]|uniref:Uncharacterized protein n=1 Tax=Corynebacterium heidelbergense TaxID=2055947 RepID=A0A364VDQ3_9CORY|nr:hypothetical protein [Corynebacterium heidelbergense]RAV34751.1 hypothetical protein CWC39_01505 [Corynebacterium heidelbergense]WCZ37011.1 hypothetical protein CHEID_07390 [Corynebacterium heidelbergense]